MKQQDLEYAKHHLRKAFPTLTEAEVLLNAGLMVGAVNRIYYACFYAVSALLLTEGYGSSKHSGVMALFNQHWVGPEHLPREMGKFYRMMFDQRQEATIPP